MAAWRERKRTSFMRGVRPICTREGISSGRVGRALDRDRSQDSERTRPASKRPYVGSHGTLRNNNK